MRFYDYVKAMLTFNFGYSFYSNRAVVDEMIGTGKLANILELLGLNYHLDPYRCGSPGGPSPESPPSF